MFCLICGKEENNANFVVWQQICQECKAEFWMIPTVNGELDMDTARQMLSDKVKLLAVTAVSNVTGAVVDIETLIAWAKIYDIPVYIDAAQAVRHRMFDLEKLQCDFLGFSAHKMMGPTGVGCLFVRKTLLNQRDYCMGCSYRLSDRYWNRENCVVRRDASSENRTDVRRHFAGRDIRISKAACGLYFFSD